MFRTGHFHRMAQDAPNLPDRSLAPAWPGPTGSVCCLRFNRVAKSAHPESSVKSKSAWMDQSGEAWALPAALASRQVRLPFGEQLLRSLSSPVPVLLFVSSCPPLSIFASPNYCVTEVRVVLCLHDFDYLHVYKSRDWCHLRVSLCEQMWT